MATPDFAEIARAEEAIRRLTDEINRNKAALIAADDALEKRKIGAATHTTIVDATTDTIARNTAEIKQHQKVLASNGVALGKWSMIAFQAGQAVEDWQFAGPIGAMNNLSFAVQMATADMQLSTKTMIGLNVGMAALSVGTTYLYRHWDELSEALGRGNKHLMTTAELARKTADELAKIEFPTLEEQGQLDAARKTAEQQQEAGQFAKSLEGPTDLQSATRSAFQKAIVEGTGGHGGQFQAQLGDMLARGMIAGDQTLAGINARAEEAHRSASLTQGSASATHAATAEAAEKEANQRRNTLKKEADDKIQQLMDEAAAGNEDALNELATRLKGIGRSGLAKSIQLAVDEARMQASGMLEAIEADQAEGERRIHVRQQITEEEALRGQAATGRFANRRGQRVSGVVGELQQRYDASGGRLNVAAALQAAGISPTGNVSADPETIVTATEQAERELAEARLRAIERVAAEERISFARAEERLTRRRAEAERQARERAEMGATHEELFSARRDRERGRAGDLVATTGADQFLVNLMMKLRVNRELGGAGMNAGEAADVARQEAFNYASRSRFAGGLGLNQEAAMQFAITASQRAAPVAQQALEQQFGGMITSSSNLREAVQAQTQLLQEINRRGVPLFALKGRRR